MADDDCGDAERLPVRRPPDELQQVRMEVRRLIARCLDPRRGTEIGAALDDEVLRLRLAIVLGDAPAIATSRRTCAHLLAALSALGPPPETS
jgi:hypothetical protein